MRKETQRTGALVLVAGAAVAAYVKRGALSAALRSYAGSPGPARIPESSGATALRARALGAVNEVVPATYPDERFALMAPGYSPTDPKLPNNFTTCAYLPGFVGGRIGINTRYGLSSIRDVAKSGGAWVEPGSGRRPEPGDFYLLGTADGSGVSHVGVILDASGATWKTADAGQGARDKQQTAKVDRPYHAKAMTLGGLAGPRPLLGWMDIVKMPKNGKGVSGVEASVLLVDGGQDGGETLPTKGKR